MKRTIINIGRKLGSGGREIGEKLAKKLGIPYYDKEIIALAAKESGLCEEVFENADERTDTRIMGAFLGLRFPCMSDAGGVSSNCLSNESLFRMQSDVIRKVAREGSAVIVGRCADYILRDDPDAINVFITAPYEVCLKRVMERHSYPEKKAKELISKVDDERAEYHNYYTDKVWGEADSYHLCIDSSLFGIDKTVDIIAEFCKRRD